MRRRIAAVVIFLLLFAGVFYTADSVVKAKFINDSTTIVNGFYAEKKNDIDVLVLGSSNSFCTIDPIVLYDNYGIAAYDFGSSSQPMNVSVLYLKEAFKTQSPKVVALEVNMIPGESIANSQENRLRWGLTDIAFSIDKLRCIYQSLGKVDAEYMSYVFPVFRYHDRWKELSKSDYTYLFKDKTNYTKGYLTTEEVSAEPVNLSDYDSEGDTWVEDDVTGCLDEICALCKKHGATLVLFKSPRQDWYSYQTRAVRELADARGLDFIDYNELVEEIGIDAAADFRDADHLNNSGAAKVSLHFGSYLTQHDTLPDRRLDEEKNSWDEASFYRQRLQPQPFMEATDLMTCMDLLQQDDGYAVIVSYKGGKDRSGAVTAPHQWIYRGGKAVFHKEWNENGVAHKWMDGKDIVLAKREGFYQVMIDDVDYYEMGKEWSIVVYDTVTAQVAAVLGYDN